MLIKWITFRADGVGTDATNCLPEQLDDAIKTLESDGFTVIDVLDGDKAGAVE